MTEFEVVTRGLRFPEGPVWMKDGSVIVVETTAGVLTRIRPNGSKETVAECGGGPNGAAIGPDGMLYVVNNGGMVFFEKDGLTLTSGEAAPGYKGGWVDRINPDTGKIDRLYESVDGRRLAGPNDIVFDQHGGFWFSDLGKHYGHITENGGIYYAKADGSSIKRVVDGLRPNGIGLSPDEKTLYGALSFESLLVAFDVIAPGEIRIEGFLPGRPVAQFAARQLLDSLAVDAEGHVCVATCFNKAGIGSADPATGAITNIPFPDMLTTNICFGGKDLQDAWITLSSTGQLIKTRWTRPGLRLAHYA